jgi:hypothetical protein
LATLKLLAVIGAFLSWQGAMRALLIGVVLTLLVDWFSHPEAVEGSRQQFRSASFWQLRRWSCSSPGNQLRYGIGG